jgi:ribonuclease BN (tRNA processing enzyme)
MLTILGAGGWLPAYGRQTASAVLRNGDEAVMIDAGTGIARLNEQPDILAGVNRLHILLTHFHLDHIAALAYLPALGICDDTTLWGPGRLLYDASTESVLSAVSHEPVHPVPQSTGHQVRDIGRRAQAHIMRIDPQAGPALRSVAGDAFDDDLVDHRHRVCPDSAGLLGSGLIAHEAWFLRDGVRNPDIHSAAHRAADVAAQAGCERLLLIHLPPFQESVEELVAEAQAMLADVTPARDVTAVSGL